MLLKQAHARLTRNQLAHLGAGEVAYIRKMRGEDVVRCFPDWPEVDPNLDLWALFSADGTPLLVTDNRTSTFYKAAESELKTISLH